MANFSFKTNLNRLSSFIAIGICIMSLILPLILYDVLITGRNHLQDPEFIARFGGVYSLYGEAKGEAPKPLSATLFDCFKLFRKLMFAISLVFIQNHPLVQISLIALTNIVYFSTLARLKPYKSKKMNKVYLVTELLFTLGTIFMIVFPLFGENLSINIYKHLGWAICLMFISSNLIEIGFLFVEQVKSKMRSKDLYKVSPTKLSTLKSRTKSQYVASSNGQEVALTL